MKAVPDPAECQGPSDLGKLEYDAENWAIVPPVE